MSIYTTGMMHSDNNTYSKHSDNDIYAYFYGNIVYDSKKWK